jgi:signal transduction histidine kinase
MSTPIRKQTIQILVLRYRWPIMIGLSILILVVEYIEHIDDGQILSGGSFLWEALVFGVLMPITGGLLLSLFYDRSKINTILDRIDRQRTLKNALLSARDWDELVTIISQIPHSIFPNLFGDALYVFDPDLGRYTRTSSWMSVEDKFPDMHPSWLNPQASSENNDTIGAVGSQMYKRDEFSIQDRRLVSYSLPIVHQNNPIAIIQLLFENQFTPDPESLLSLSDLIVDIALAIQNYQHQSNFIIQSAAARAERQRIARQLHDTLAQDLAFVRLKLEQLMNNERLYDEREFKSELFRLYKTADHSYEQVRDSLKSINEDTNLEFTTALHDSAKTIAETLNFRVELIQEGSPVLLSIEKQLKILYIMREVLRNIGKHAQANLTTINIRWDNDCVQIDTIDNGRGFNIDTVLLEKQTYGLNIIEKVVTELNGRFELQSGENDGTRIHFWFPISE